MRRAQQPGQTRKAAAMCAETLSGGNAAPALTRRDGCLAPPALHLLSSSSHAGFTLAGSSLIHTAHSHAVVLSQAAAALWLPLLLAQLQRCPSAPRALLLLPLSAAASSAVRCCRGAPACCCPPARSSSRRVELLTRRAPRAGSPPPRAPVCGRGSMEARGREGRREAAQKQAQAQGRAGGSSCTVPAQCSSAASEHPPWCHGAPRCAPARARRRWHASPLHSAACRGNRQAAGGRGTGGQAMPAAGALAAGLLAASPVAEQHHT